MTAYEKLKAIIDETDILIQKDVSSSSSDLEIWKVATARFLATQFGYSSFEYEHFKKTYFHDGFYYASSCRTELVATKQILSSYLQEFEDGLLPINSMKLKAESHVGDFRKVFIVHGHDAGLKEAVSRLLERQGIEPVSLQEKANPGLATIIEKFETNSADVDAAICLFTADDVGGLATSKKRTKRARQNVVLETGFFIGKLGRDRVIIIKEDGVEIPSDLAGMDLPTANKADWKSTVLQALEKIGYAINYQIAFSKNR